MVHSCTVQQHQPTTDYSYSTMSFGGGSAKSMRSESTSFHKSAFAGASAYVSARPTQHSAYGAAPNSLCQPPSLLPRESDADDHVR